MYRAYLATGHPATLPGKQGGLLIPKVHLGIIQVLRVL